MAFKLVKDIPIFDEHEIKDDEGKVIFKVDEALLDKIIANNNKRIADTGDLTPVVIGHTKDHAHEKDQPPIIAYAVKYYKKDLFNTGRKAIHNWWLVDEKDIPTLNKFPRRSVEYWPNRKEIDPISLLGATAPERDLGLLHIDYSRFSNDSFHYAREIDMDLENKGGKPDAGSADPDNALVQKILSALMQTEQFKFLDELMQSIKEGDGGQPGADGTQPPAPGGAPAPGATEPPGKGPVPYNAGGPSGSNTFVPGDDNEKLRMQREQEIVQRFERQNQELQNALIQLKADNVNLQLKFSRKERQVVLEGLQNEGYQFDLAEELNDTNKLNDKDFEGRVTRIRQRYQRAPINGSTSAIQSSRPMKFGRKEMSREDAEKVAEYALSHRVSFEEATEKLSGQSVL